MNLTKLKGWKIWLFKLHNIKESASVTMLDTFKSLLNISILYFNLKLCNTEQLRHCLF